MDANQPNENDASKEQDPVVTVEVKDDAIATVPSPDLARRVMMDKAEPSPGTSPRTEYQAFPNLTIDTTVDPLVTTSEPNVVFANIEQTEDQDNSRVVRDDLGFPVDEVNVHLYQHYVLSKHANRKEKLKNKWKDVKFSDTLVLDKKKLRTLAASGITNELRGMFWCYCSGANKKRENANFNSETGSYYFELSKKASEGKRLPSYDEVDKDVSRTFPDLVSFNDEAKDKLRRVLYAYARRNKALGYCQSMNFIAAWSLLFMDEEDAFWLLTTIVEDLLPGFYSKNMISIQVYHRILNELLAEKLPELYKHLEKLYVSLPLITTKWFMLLFVSCVPTEVVVRIWDTFFFDGPELLFRIALGIFKLLEDDLLKTNSTIQVCKILKERPHTIFDWKHLFKPASKIDIAGERIELMRIKHKQELLKELDELRQKRNLRELTKVTHFTPGELEAMKGQFTILASLKAEKANRRTSEAMDFPRFKKVFCHIFPNWNEEDPALHHLFAVFDQDKDNVVDFRELVVGLSILTKGTPEERLELCFKSLDTNNDGQIAKEEMLFMLRGVYKNVFSDEEGNTGRVRSVTAFVDMCFANLDADGDGKLTFDEFKKVAVIEPQILEAFQAETNSEPSPSNNNPTTDFSQVLSLADVSTLKEETEEKGPFPPPEWEPDKAVSRCPYCSTVFVFPIKRRHHCRSCGKVVCKACSEYSLPLPKFGYYRPVRVCHACYSAVQSQKKEKRDKHRTTALP